MAHWLALQTTEAVVPGLILASLTVENSENRQSHFVYTVKSRGREGNLSRGQKKEFKNLKNERMADLRLFDLSPMQVNSSPVDLWLFVNIVQ